MSASPRAGWGRRLVRRLLHLGDTPRRTAAAFGLGVFLSFSPFWGLHTILGLVAAFALRLNRLAVLVGVYVNTPWTMAPAASLGTALGVYLLGGRGRFPGLEGVPLWSREMLEGLVADADRLLLPFLVGNTIVAVGAGLTAYFVLLSVLERRQRRRRQAGAVAGHLKGEACGDGAP